MNSDKLRKSLLALAAAFVLLPPATAWHSSPERPLPARSGRGEIADFFSQVGDQIYEDCIFELSQEQLDVQQALIQAYIKQGATSLLARQLAVKQIQPPKLSADCEQIKVRRKPTAPSWPRRHAPGAEEADGRARPCPSPIRADVPSVALADKKVLPQWDCGPNVDFVTISTTATRES